jgi:hypothetical protein
MVLVNHPFYTDISKAKKGFIIKRNVEIFVCHLKPFQKEVLSTPMHHPFEHF